MTTTPVAPVDQRPAPAPRPPRRASSRLRERALFAATVVAAIVAALALAGALLTVTDSTPGDVYEAMLRGSLGSKVSLVSTLNHTGPILVVAIGACLAGRAGLVNIGQEGQFLVGGLIGAVVGLYAPGPGWIVLPLILVGSAVGGAGWALGPAVLRYGRGVNEVITTLLLNFLAIQLVSWMVNRSYLLQETLPAGSVTSASPQTDRLDEAVWLPVLTSGRGYRLNASVLVGVVLALVFGFVVARTGWGFRLRIFGCNTRMAQRTGIAVGPFGGSVLTLSGAFAGLAGGLLLTGTSLRVNPGFANNYGWEGLLVALVANYSIAACIVVAFLFGALRAGGGVLASTGVSPSIVGVVQALIVLAVTLPTLWMRRLERRRQQLTREDAR